MSDHKPYRPSNGTEGDIFTARFCAKCTKREPVGSGPCKIEMYAMVCYVNDPDYPKEWRYVDGKPTCTAFDDQPPLTEADRKYLAYMAERKQAQKAVGGQS